MIQLLKGDCLIEMDKLIADGVKVDAIITDPPYEFKDGGFGGGVGEISKRSLKSDIDNEKLHQSLDMESLFEDYYKYLLKKVNVVSFCTERMLNKYVNYCEKNNYYYTVLVWNKTNPTPLCNNRYLNSIEFIIHIREKGVKILGNYHSKGKVYTSPVNKKDKKEFKHPTIKPIELIEKFLLNHTEENELVLDPFMGSGTTGVACKNLNRNFIGIEKDNNYFKIAENRIKEIQVQTKLF